MDYDRLVEAAMRALNEGDPSEGLRLSTAARSVKPSGTESHFLEALALGRLGNGQRAMEILNGLIAAGSTYPKTHAIRGELQDELAPATTEIVVDTIGSSEIESVVQELIDRALTAVQRGDSATAMQAIIEAKRHKLRVRDLDHVRAMCFIARQGANYLGEARQALLEELRHYPDNKGAQHLLDEVIEEQRAAGADSVKTGDAEFDELLSEVRPYTMLPEARLFTLFQLAKQVCQADIPGNFAECGVAGGGSSALLAVAIKRYSRRPRTLFAFDSYEGMPEPSEHDIVKGKDAESTGWGTGTCAAPEESVKKISAKLGVAEIVVPVKGYFETTLPRSRSTMGQLAFLHADCDWYESAKTILINLYDCVVPGGVFQIDDYGYWDGMKKAIDEFQSSRSLRFEIRNIDGGSAWFQKPVN